MIRRLIYYSIIIFLQSQAYLQSDENELPVKIEDVIGGLESLMGIKETEQPEPQSIPRNETTFESSGEIANDTRKHVVCKRPFINATIEEKSSQSVEMINATRLTEILTPDADVLNRESEAQCAVILFYSRNCPFSSLAAPQFNALARIFPDLKMAAVDSIKHSRVNTQYSIFGVPSAILFHNARAVAKFNGSDYSIQAFTKFIRTYTAIEEEMGSVTSEDFQGPIPSATSEEVDYILLLAWVFVIFVKLYYLSGTRLWKAVVETVKNTWREAEAQHEHAE